MNATTLQRKPTVLVTGFAPFAGESVNPSWEAARALDGKLVADRRICAVELPCEFAAALPALRRALRRVHPQIAIAVGLAGGRDGISLERVAINLIDARIPDNAGAQPIDMPIVRGGGGALFTRLPVKAALAALHDAGIPAHLSYSAGTYVCNEVFYALLHATRRQSMSAGFVHVPWLPEQAARHRQPGMALAETCRALEIIIATTLATREDLHVAGGTVA